MLGQLPTANRYDKGKCQRPTATTNCNDQLQRPTEDCNEETVAEENRDGNNEYAFGLRDVESLAAKLQTISRRVPWIPACVRR